MTNHVSDDEVNPKGMPNSDRHRSETAVHQPTDEHQTEAAKQAVEQEVAKKNKAGAESEGEA